MHRKCRARRDRRALSEQESGSRKYMRPGQNREKDYRKLSRIKTGVFLLLAVLVLAGMFLREKTGKQDRESVPVQTEQSRQTQIPRELIRNGSENGNGGTVIQTAPESSRAETEVTAAEPESPTAALEVAEDGVYSDAGHVALYLHTYRKLPSNYISKTKAREQGWIQERGNLWDVLPGMSIGGGPFLNEEGVLPDRDGRSWKECDIDYAGGARNEKRLVWSNDGLIYYTQNHYRSFTCIYGEE